MDSTTSSFSYDQPNLDQAKGRLDKGNTALLMIDFQRDFCAPGGYADAAFNGGLEWVTGILPQARKLLEFARQNGLTIIHTREGYASDLSDVSEVKQRKSVANGAPIGSKGPMGRFLIRGEHGQATIDELAPLISSSPKEIVLDKASFGTFATTNLQEILQKQKIQHLIFAGVTADVCVHTTLREATDRGYECWYCKDAISTPDPIIREACERMIVHEGGIWGWLVSVDEITNVKF